MNNPMIPVVDSNLSYVKPNVKWLSVDDIHYVEIVSREKGKFKYHTNTGTYYSITRIEDLTEALSVFNLMQVDRSVIVNPNHMTQYDDELRVIHFPSGMATVAASHVREIKSLIS